ncbi:ATPase [Treponema sp. TIM-1]|uniref:ATPase n=1 Tax=Treponema sp. TIM-1 TaxID=2898417 RepID=UPI00398164E8
MEELRSTDILDREILEDARRKAYRILKTADDTVQSAEELWKKKTEDAVADIGRRYERREEQTRTEIMARLPLDKRRIRSEKVESFLQSAIEGYLTGLSRERILSLLEEELAKRFRKCPELEDPRQGELPVIYRGLTQEEVRGLLQRVFPQGVWVLKQAEPGFRLPGTFPALVADTQAVRIIASIDGIARELLEDKRAELVAALLGEDFWGD